MEKANWNPAPVKSQRLRYLLSMASPMPPLLPKQKGQWGRHDNSYIFSAWDAGSWGEAEPFGVPHELHSSWKSLLSLEPAGYATSGLTILY